MNELEQAVTELLDATIPFPSALEGEYDADLEELRLRLARLVHYTRPVDDAPGPTFVEVLELP